MKSDNPEFTAAFNTANPNICECASLEPAAKASFELVLSQGGSLEEALAAARCVIDPHCKGMKKAPVEHSCVAFTGCGVREMVCGHTKGPNFLLEHALAIILKTA